MTNPAALCVLQASPLFRGAPPDVLDQLSSLAHTRKYRRGEVVFLEGSPGDKLYGVISGRLLITTSSADGADLHLNVAERGEIIGEIAFLDGGMRTATARAAQPSTCLEIDRSTFFAVLERCPALSTHLLQLVCRRVREMTRSAADSAFLSVAQRLASRLMTLARPVNGDGYRAEVRISQAELADFLGVSRQVVNGYLQEWKRGGMVELSRGAIRIKDLGTFSRPETLSSQGKRSFSH